MTPERHALLRQRAADARAANERREAFGIRPLYAVRVTPDEIDELLNAIPGPAARPSTTTPQE